MTRYESIPGALSGTAIVKLVRVLVAVYGLADFSGGPEWFAIPAAADLRSQIEALLMPDGALLLGANGAGGQNHGGLHVDNYVYSPIGP